jgi:hypothetical protein
MSKLGLFFLWSSFILFFNEYSLAQQKKDSIADNALYLNIDNLNFIKNNEYFNNIADGYTLLGSYLHPKLSFYPSSKTKLELGLFGLTYAGLDEYKTFIPTFSFTYSMKDSELVMGTLQNNQGHKLIEPLMTFESQLDERSIENGLQFILKKKQIQLDTWINWEEFIFKGDTKNEEFVMGISTDFQIINTNKWLIKIPFQNLFYHRGGQINTNQLQNRVVFTMRNTALGILIKNKLNKEQSIEFKSYILQNKSSSNPQEYIYSSGDGWLTMLDYKYKNWMVGAGYWYGNQFVSPKGNDMFQSVSVKTDVYYENGILQEIYTGHTEPKRTLFLGNFSYHKNITENIQLGFVVKGYYQNYSASPTPEIPTSFTDNQFDYSMGLYINYHGNFRIK